MTPIAFLDIETTGLDPNRHEIWELAIIRPDLPVSAGGKIHLHLPVNLSMADPGALRLTNFYERRKSAFVKLESEMKGVAYEVAEALAGCRLAGNVIYFDESFLAPFLRRWGQAPAWHYHLIDVETLAVGHLMAELAELEKVLEHSPPLVDTDRLDKLRTLHDKWDSKSVSALLGVALPETAHTAMGDAYQALEMYEAVCGPLKYYQSKPIS